MLHFQLGLIPTIRAQVRDRVFLYRDLQQQLPGFVLGSLPSSTPYQITSLKKMIELAVNIERSALVSASMTGSSDEPSSSSSSTTTSGSSASELDHTQHCGVQAL
jgi:hypothetical protein